MVKIDCVLPIIMAGYTIRLNLKMMAQNDQLYSTESFPSIRKATVDLLTAAKRKNMIHSMIEVDITRARETLRSIKKESKAFISFTGYIIHCAASAVESNKRLHAYRNRKNQIVLFSDVDVSTTIEHKVEGNSEVVAMIIRAANRKTIQEISSEILEEKSKDAKDADVYKSMKLFLTLPVFIRRFIFRILDKSPHLMKKRAGTIMVTSANMVGRGAGWGVPIATHTLNITIGGIVDRIVASDGGFEKREHLCLTLSFDHDIVDGAPAARFVRDFKKIIESGKISE
jgi:pyruvate/2-oxoglutarate dehydrogenase complex dihydrolipoamide acyltransferase (E2) component